MKALTSTDHYFIWISLIFWKSFINKQREEIEIWAIFIFQYIAGIIPQGLAQIWCCYPQGSDFWGPKQCWCIWFFSFSMIVNICSVIFTQFFIAKSILYYQFILVQSYFLLVSLYFYMGYGQFGDQVSRRIVCLASKCVWHPSVCGVLALISATSERPCQVRGGAPGAPPLSILALEPILAKKSCFPESCLQFQLIWPFFRIFFP